MNTSIISVKKNTKILSLSDISTNAIINIIKGNTKI